MEVDFLKMQGNGEDLVVVDRCPRDPDDPPAAGMDMPLLASRMLDRTTGVGGSALAVLSRGTQERLAVRGWSPAGEPAPLASSALRCVARYASDAGLVSDNDFRVETGSATVRATVIDSVNVRVDAGMPFEPEQAAVIREKPAASFSRGIVVGDRTVSYTPVSLGTPWAVVFVENFSFPVAGTARRIAAHPDFAEGVGIGFVQVRDRETLRVRTWSPREWRRTRAGASDGDFAAAAIVAAVVHGFSDREVFARLPGGAVYLQWEESDNHVYMTGPALYVFTGTYDFDEPAA
jgi:diaminopimelate epimerase